MNCKRTSYPKTDIDYIEIAKLVAAGNIVELEIPSCIPIKVFRSRVYGGLRCALDASYSIMASAEGNRLIIQRALKSTSAAWQVVQAE
jgi:hypothetical protein